MLSYFNICVCEYLVMLPCTLENSELERNRVRSLLFATNINLNFAQWSGFLYSVHVQYVPCIMTIILYVNRLLLLVFLSVIDYSLDLSWFLMASISPCQMVEQ